ncbi:MAG: Asp-tRNA(Asn)/Glu-tRNA(Gln) amidotransferase subunit GatA [Saprospiraceae bacterium]|nr:Asp-tRNA(Asn)/Glu-tRNA(Gln) amidotransferase subunit GatA [Saprospiraceae bacterium]
MNPRYSCLGQIQNDLLEGNLSCTDLVQYYLQNIRSTASLNAYIEVYAEEALEQARLTDEKIKTNSSSLGKCFGLVISVKDNICQEGKRVEAASGILKGFTSLYTATALERLLEEGAIVIGRVNCDQFGMGNSNENSVYGPVRNADNPERIPGGSSGGSAVAVQTDTCLVSLCSDTGGSIRQPAGFCGVYGLKPTYGRISRHGLLAYASSFDQIGFIGRDPEDFSLLLSVCSGPDQYDASMLPVDDPSDDEEVSLPGRIAFLSEEVYANDMDPTILDGMTKLRKNLGSMGFECNSFSFPMLDYLVPAYYTLTTAEASTNLARYDGIRYGMREESKDLQETYSGSRTKGFSQEVKRRILLGTFVLSSGYYDAYFGKAQKIRGKIKTDLDRILEYHDIVLLPLSPQPAWEIGAYQEDPVKSYLADVFTVLANLAGYPALAIPLGTHPNGTKFGFQILAKSLQEKQLIAFSTHLKDKLTKM